MTAPPPGSESRVSSTALKMGAGFGSSPELIPLIKLINKPSSPSFVFLSSPFPLLPPVPRVVEFLTELHNTMVLEGEDATFKCVVSPEDVQLVWGMDGELVVMGDRFQATQNGLCHTLVIKSCQILDSSKITVEAEGNVSKATLKVQGESTADLGQIYMANTFKYLRCTCLA